MPAGYTVRACGSTSLGSFWQGEQDAALVARCEARSPPRTRTGRTFIQGCPEEYQTCVFLDWLCAEPSPYYRCALRRGNNRQRSTAQTHGLQQPARDKPLSGIIVLLRPILYAWSHAAVSLKVVATRAQPY
jgi:hypothetical protein